MRVFSMRPALIALAAAVPLTFALSLAAQEPNPTAVAPGARSAEVIAKGDNGIYVYHVKVVQRELDAVNYLNRSGSTKVGFEGTNLMPKAHGEGEVDAKTGKTNIHVKFNDMSPANGYGPEYLTYVLWAISADGRPQNLGELELAGKKASLDVTTGFQSFGMIVTAEPYYAVTTPSDVIVLKNIFRKDTQGILQTVDVHYSLLPRGLYANTEGRKSNPEPITDRQHTPLALYEAYNAQRIAQNAGADKYAPEVMKEVQQDISNAQSIQDGKRRDVKMLFTLARAAVQRSEDARLITLRKQAAERQQQAQQAKVDAQQQAQQSQLAAVQAQAAADRASAQRAQADAQRAQAEVAAADARARTAQAQRAATDAQQRADSAQQSEQALRERLLSQLNAVLQTKETPRGLVVNLSDVLFDTGKYSLKQNTQISLAKVATILQLYPGLKVQVEGYTDSTGSPATNQKLSDNRAGAVRNFMVNNGVSQDNITDKGYGATDFTADNNTAAGRAQNRRVELIVSGSAIGVPTTSGPGAPGAGTGTGVSQ